MYTSNHNLAMSSKRLHIFHNDWLIGVIDTRLHYRSMCTTHTPKYIGSMRNAHTQMLTLIRD